VKYDLAKMLAEIARDERAGQNKDARVLTQEQIKELTRSRGRRRRTDKPATPK
jgi:hypothetical protein